MESAPPSNTTPTAREPLDVATTQASAISPLHTPEGKALAARAEARKRLGQTAIGIAPPAMGSNAPPEAVRPVAPSNSVAASERPTTPSKPPLPTKPPSPFTDTLVAVAPPNLPKPRAEHPLAVTTKSTTPSNVPLPGGGKV
ncbi:MAG: hypothetical protein K0S65_539, partial [Labilithrix sp.]|nr:hypothetical protein [Labilithrix sp.]